jgi:hypothetical protein
MRTVSGMGTCWRRVSQGRVEMGFGGFAMLLQPDFGVGWDPTNDLGMEGRGQMLWCPMH